MKKYIDGIKTLIGDERGKAILKLGIYLIFILILIIYVRITARNIDDKEVQESSYEVFIEQTNYLANIKIGDEEISLIGGEVISFEYADEQYTVVDSKLTKNNKEVDEFPIQFWKLTPKFIGELLDKEEPEFTSNYKDGSIRLGYKMSLRGLMNHHDFSNTDVSQFEEIPLDEYIEIIIDDNISKIELVTLKLDSYYKFLTGEEKEFTVEIKY